MCSLNLVILVSLETVSDASGAADHLATNLPFLSFLFQIEYWRDGMVVGTNARSEGGIERTAQNF